MSNGKERVAVKLFCHHITISKKKKGKLYKYSCLFFNGKWIKNMNIVSSSVGPKAATKYNRRKDFFSHSSRFQSIKSLIRFSFLLQGYP